MKISIIVPVYNVEEYIEKCLITLMNQTYKNIEVIIVNDGTQDNSIAIAKALTSEDSRFVYVDKENGGLSDARNFGLKFATGDFVTFIDSDDYVDIKYIQKMVSALITSGCNMVVGGVMIDQNQNLFHHCLFNSGAVKSEEALKKMRISTTSVAFSSAWGKLVPKKWYTEIQFPVGKIHEDEFTTYKLYLKSSGVYYVDEPLYYYRIRENSIMTQPKSFKNLSYLEALEERVEIFKEKNISLQETLISYYRYVQLLTVKLNKSDFLESKMLLKNKEKWVIKQLKSVQLTLKQRISLIVFKYLKYYYFKKK